MLNLENIQERLLPYPNPRDGIHISDELSEFLNDVGLSVSSRYKVLELDVASKIKTYLEMINEFAILKSEWGLTEENLEKVKFYKNLTYFKNLENNNYPFRTVVDYYYHELTHKIKDADEERERIERAKEVMYNGRSPFINRGYMHYGYDGRHAPGRYCSFRDYPKDNVRYVRYPNDKDKKYLEQSTDTSLPADKIESTSNLNTSNLNTTEEITIKPDLMLFLSSFSIDLPSANIDKRLALAIKDFLERDRCSYMDYYDELYKRNSSKCDYSSILQKLGLRIDRTNYYLEKLNKSIESSE